jgi:hypothetical protein
MATTNDPVTDATATDAVHAETDVNAVDVQVTLRVKRGAMGNLPAGVRERLAGVDGVDGIDVGEIENVRPDALDIHVDVGARLTGAFPTDADAIHDTVADAFGIETVHAVAVEYAPDYG